MLAAKSPLTQMSSTAIIRMSGVTNGGRNGVGRSSRFDEMFTLPLTSIEPVVNIVTAIGAPFPPTLPFSSMLPPLAAPVP